MIFFSPFKLSGTGKKLIRMIVENVHGTLKQLLARKMLSFCWIIQDPCLDIVIILLNSQFAVYWIHFPTTIL